jgi:hypothetical protein
VRGPKSSSWKESQLESGYRASPDRPTTGTEREDSDLVKHAVFGLLERFFAADIEQVKAQKGHSISPEQVDMSFQKYAARTVVNALD